MGFNRAIRSRHCDSHSISMTTAFALVIISAIAALASKNPNISIINSISKPEFRENHDQLGIFPRIIAAHPIGLDFVNNDDGLGGRSPIIYNDLVNDDVGSTSSLSMALSISLSPSQSASLLPSSSLPSSSSSSLPSFTANQENQSTKSSQYEMQHKTIKNTTHNRLIFDTGAGKSKIRSQFQSKPTIESGSESGSESPEKTSLKSTEIKQSTLTSHNEIDGIKIISKLKPSFLDDSNYYSDYNNAIAENDTKIESTSKMLTELETGIRNGISTNSNVIVPEENATDIEMNLELDAAFDDEFDDVISEETGAHITPVDELDGNINNKSMNTSTSKGNRLNVSLEFDHNNNLWAGNLSEEQDLPTYVRVTAFIFLLIIFAVGTIGNTMVIIVIHCSRDMRTSTNIFLVNLSVADLLLLLICTPTCLMEVYYDPEIWLLGAAMCKLVPLLEVTVAHASVLTILAISFERYYAICCPLKANYVCTKTRAISICVGTWIAAGVITSPMYFMTNYFIDSQNKPHCEVGAGTLWTDSYTISSIIIFFLLPLIILLITYGLIARNLTTDKSRLKHNYTRQNHRARQQVVLMLGTVVFTFFLCLLPFRVLTIFVVLSEQNPFTNMEIYYNVEYFCRIMLYTNSALNPILYNIMSSKFRNGFLILCSRRRRRLSRFQRQGTFHTLTTTSSTSTTSNLPNNFIHSTSIPSSIIPISSSANSSLIDRNRNRNRNQNKNRGTIVGLSRCDCPCSCCCCSCHNISGHFWTGKIFKDNNETKFLSNKNKNLDLDRYSYSFTNINLNSSPKLYPTFCKKCCEFESKSKLGAKWLHKHLTLSPGGSAMATTTTTTSSGLILSQGPDFDQRCGQQHEANCCLGLGGGRCCGGKCHCHLYCSKTYSREISSENNIVDKCFSLNCQICQRRRKGHILAAVQEDRNRRVKTGGVEGSGGKLTIKMAMKTNYYSCSFSSFSNTNTMETIL